MGNYQRTGLSGRANTRARRARHVVGGVLDGALGTEGGRGIKGFEEKRHGDRRGAAGSQAQEYIATRGSLQGRPSDKTEVGILKRVGRLRGKSEMITASDMLRNTLKKCRFERGPPKKAWTSQGPLEFARRME